MAKVVRYRKMIDAPDDNTYDICYVDRKTGREVMRYDGADPANTNPEYGAISDEECFYNKGLDKEEMIEETEIVSDDLWMHRYSVKGLYDE